MEHLRQSNEMKRGKSAQMQVRIAVLIIYEARSEGTEPIAPNHSESHRQFLRYQENSLLEPVTQDMLSSQMHRLRTPSRKNTPSNRHS